MAPVLKRKLKTLSTRRPVGHPAPTQCSCSDRTFPGLFLDTHCSAVNSAPGKAQQMGTQHWVRTPALALLLDTQHSPSARLFRTDKTAISGEAGTALSLSGRGAVMRRT